MDEQVIAIFLFNDEIVKSFDFYNDPQNQMSIAEIMSFALIFRNALSRQLSNSPFCFDIIEVFL